MYIAIVLGLLAGYFAYVVASHGSTYAFSVENLKWFGSSLALYSAMAGLVAALACLSRTTEDSVCGIKSSRCIGFWLSAARVCRAAA